MTSSPRMDRGCESPSWAAPRVQRVDLRIGSRSRIASCTSTSCGSARGIRPEGIRAISDAIGAACPNLTLIGIGAPRQELLADSLRRRVCGPIVCCGAAIEVLAGDTPRAPAVLRKTGLEWAFRLIREPRRLGPRYLAAGTSFGARSQPRFGAASSVATSEHHLDRFPTFRSVPPDDVNSRTPPGRHVRLENEGDGRRYACRGVWISDGGSQAGSCHAARLLP